MNNLDFLDKFLYPQTREYEAPLFLKTGFHENQWIIEYSDKKTSIIDFDIQMADGLLLTNKKYDKLLNTLKYWIVFHTIENENYKKSKSIMQEAIFAILTLFDTFNIDKDDTHIHHYGFEYLSDGYIKHVLDKISSHSDKFLSIYQLKERVIKHYLKTNNISVIGKVNEDSIDNWDNFEKFYQDISLQSLYPDTILKPVRKLAIKNIKIEKVRQTQEYDNIFQQEYSENEKRSFLSIKIFKDALVSLRKLHKNSHKFEYPLSLPQNNILENIEYFSTHYKGKGRYKTVPSSVIFSYIKNAIEFHYNYGDDIVRTYMQFSNALAKQNYDFTKFQYTEELNEIFLKCLSPKLKEIGVKAIKADNNKLYEGKERFNLLRQNLYFYDLLKVYYGAIQVVIGALMARRQAELASLRVGQCIDELSSSLTFKQAKSTKGIFGVKNTLYLPIDELGIKMIKNLEEIHQHKDGDLLFSMPQIKNIFSFKNNVDNTTYSENIDFFIDYIQGEVKDGKRYYIRQHQLRRFFAMCFFWGSGFGSLDTLRWFMGHTDVEHVYHYITESTSGEVLKSVKTQYLLENIEKYENLLSLIKNKYHTEKFDLIESEDLEEYLQDLLENETIIVEPEFVHDDNQDSYKIIVKITGENNV